MPDLFDMTAAVPAIRQGVIQRMVLAIEGLPTRAPWKMAWNAFRGLSHRMLMKTAPTSITIATEIIYFMASLLYSSLPKTLSFLSIFGSTPCHVVSKFFFIGIFGIDYFNNAAAI